VHAFRKPDNNTALDILGKLDNTRDERTSVVVYGVPVSGKEGCTPVR
jgi:hypothetical protein